MKIVELNQNIELEKNAKVKELYFQFEKLLIELRKKELPDGVVLSINKEVEDLNTTSCSGSELRKILKEKQTRIIKLLEKELKLVPKNYYRNIWLALGMGAFGLPIGVAFASIIGNLAFLGIGLPIGMSIGVAVGTGLDKKAFNEGRQIDLEIKH
jgi:hypothetical protein